LAGRGVNTASRRTIRLPVPGMAAGRPSQLARRIRRLLDGAPTASTTQVPMTPLEGLGPSRRRRAILLAAVPTVLLAVTLAAPGVSAGSSPSPATAARTVVPGAAEAGARPVARASMVVAALAPAEA